MEKSSKPTKYLTTRDLQIKLGGRGRTTIYRDVELGRLPKPVKLGGRLYWAEADVDAAIAAHAGSQTVSFKTGDQHDQ